MRLKTILLIGLISIVGYTSSKAQPDYKFRFFHQYCLCNSRLFSNVDSDSILNMQLSDDVLNIDLIATSTCYTKHLGAVKFDGDTLHLKFSHESWKPKKGFQVIGYVPNDIVEIADCESKFLFGFVLWGVKEKPKVIMLNEWKVIYQEE